MPNRCMLRTTSLLLALVLCLAATIVREPVAVLVSVAGKVELVKQGGKAVAASVGQSLDSGDRLIITAGGKAVLMYSTGRMQTATAPLTVAAPARENRGGLYARTAGTIAQVATADANRQPNRQGMIRPVQGEATPISPRNDVRLLDVRPPFTWAATAPGTRYLVQLRRTDVPGVRPVRFEAGSDTTWTYPASAQPLVPGGSYEWTVGPVSGGRVAQTQRFRIVDAEQFALVSDALRQLSTEGVDPATDGLFVMALVHRQAGLLYEAERALARLAEAGAGSGRVYHLLRGEVLDGLGELDAAAREFAAADAEAGK